MGMVPCRQVETGRGVQGEMASLSQVEIGRGVWGNSAFSSGGNCERHTGYNGIFSGSDLEGVKGAIPSSSQRLEGVMDYGEKRDLHLRYRPVHVHGPWGRENVEGHPSSLYPLCQHIGIPRPGTVGGQ